jgi:hypothetical protein
MTDGIEGGAGHLRYAESLTCCQARQARVKACRGRAAYAACSTLCLTGRTLLHAYIDGFLKRLLQVSNAPRFQVQAF